MNTQTQFRAAYVLLIALSFLGIIIVGMSIGFGLSAQTASNAGCRQQVLQEPTSCQQAIQVMSSRAWKTALLGLGATFGGGGGLYKLRQYPP